jgi:glycosyltransferase involved in cell wall biosynthesis
MSAELVSVVIPAHNAEDTIDETLRSVRSQTHHALEIIVVDDGSRDQTASIARRHCEIDLRVRLIDQANAGVAAARNTGWQAARSHLIAFVDADDLWAPTKIEQQLAALRRADDKVGLVYCWYSVIDSEGSVAGEPYRPCWRGDVLERSFLGNFVGNGSTALVRRQALIDANGFDSRLRGRTVARMPSSTAASPKPMSSKSSRSRWSAIAICRETCLVTWSECCDPGCWCWTRCSAATRGRRASCAQACTTTRCGSCGERCS